MNDNVFVFYSNHGGFGVLEFSSGASVSKTGFVSD